jgi:hypothetical protein
MWLWFLIVLAGLTVLYVVDFLIKRFLLMRYSKTKSTTWYVAYVAFYFVLALASVLFYIFIPKLGANLFALPVAFVALPIVALIPFPFKASQDYGWHWLFSFLLYFLPFTIITVVVSTVMFVI